MSRAVMIVAGEASGELYGALLAGALRKRDPALSLIGIGGERMREEGVELIAGIASVFGLAEAVASLRQIRLAFRKAVDAIDRLRPSVLVLIDYPDFNLRLAAEARKRGIRVLYYVSPQVWAWRKGRVRKIAALVDMMAVVLPFEEAIYRQAGLRCEFVGHPVLDEIGAMEKDRDAIRSSLGVRPHDPILSLLPGSRPNELTRLLPLMLDTVRQCRKEFPALQFTVPLAPNTEMDDYRDFFSALRGEGALVLKGGALRCLAVSDLAVIASGTATLQAALLGVPLVVVYRLFPLTFWLGKRIVHVEHVSLVNILAGRAVVRELLQAEASVENVMAELRRISTDGRHREEMTRSFSAVRSLFANRSASTRVAEIVAEMTGLPG